jgi:Uma2 family endonuclease
MATTAGEQGDPPGSPLAVPTEDAWRTMSPEERLDVQVRILDVLSDPVSLMSEGRPHKRAKSRAIDALHQYFRTTGRVIYLAEEMAVLYPGRDAFSPDILAFLDVPQPDDDQRMSWVVVDEGKGLDLVIEVLHRGDRNKDLVQNVERYAQLSIPEYFVYDRGRQQIHGYRLPGPGTTRYQRIVPQLGRYRSTVLGLDLMILGDELRFFAGMSELPGADELIDRLQGMMTSLETKAHEAEARALREAILALLQARAMPLPEEARADLESCTDTATLRRWLLRAAKAASSDDVFAPEPVSTE